MAKSRRQLHIRLPEIDHEFLAALAERRSETVASVLRSVIRSMRANVERSRTAQQAATPMTTHDANEFGRREHTSDQRHDR
jgi:hypothetical protein